MLASSYSRLTKALEVRGSLHLIMAQGLVSVVDLHLIPSDKLQGPVTSHLHDVHAVGGPRAQEAVILKRELICHLITCNPISGVSASLGSSV